MDVSRLGHSYSSREASPPIKDDNPYNLPDLGSSSAEGLKFAERKPMETRLSHDRIEILNNHWSEDRALISLRMSGLHDPNGNADVKLRSPLLQKGAQSMAKAWVSEPLKQAWETREVSGSALTALGLGLAGVAGAVYSSEEVKSRVTLMQNDVGEDYKLKTSLGVTSGDGKVDMSTAKLTLSPRSESANTHWNLDLEYRTSEDRIGLSYQRHVSRVQVGPSEGFSYLQAGISHDNKQGTMGHISYHLSF
jgi:hypothetical protein